MAIKTGEVVLFKTTGESAFALKLYKDGDEKAYLTGEMVVVRYPVVTRDGIKYILGDFNVEELESFQDRFQRLKTLNVQLESTIEQAKGEVKAIGKPLEEALTNLENLDGVDKKKAN